MARFPFHSSLSRSRRRSAPPRRARNRPNDIEDADGDSGREANERQSGDRREYDEWTFCKSQRAGGERRKAARRKRDTQCKQQFAYFINFCKWIACAPATIISVLRNARRRSRTDRSNSSALAWLSLARFADLRPTHTLASADIQFWSRVLLSLSVYCLSPLDDNVEK